MPQSHATYEFKDLFAGCCPENVKFTDVVGHNVCVYFDQIQHLAQNRYASIRSVPHVFHIQDLLHCLWHLPHRYVVASMPQRIADSVHLLDAPIA